MFSQRLKTLRSEKHMTQLQFAEAFSISAGTIAMWETAKRTPDTAMLIRIARYFGVSVDYLIGKSNFRNGVRSLSSFCNVSDPDFEDAFDFGRLIKAEREGQQISLEKMSEALGLTESDLDGIEMGVLPINENLAKRLTAYLGTTISQLLFDNGLYGGAVPEEYHDRVDEYEALLARIDEEALRERGDSSISQTAIYTPAEITHIKKYRALDEHGTKAVDSILDIEYERCASSPKVIPFPEATRVIPYSYIPASAGVGEWLDVENMDEIEIPDVAEYRNADFAVPVAGDSMEPTYSDGDILLIHEQDAVNIGDIGLFAVDGHGYVKELGDGVLISRNRGYKDIPIGEGFRCFGKVIGKLK